MAFNFAETFLRESGAAQDRSRSMAEMQLRAKQFADEMVLKEADLAVREKAQQLAEDVEKEAALFRIMDLNQKETQFNANLQQRINEFSANIELKGRELNLTEKQINQEKELFTARLNEESEARKAQIKLAYDQLSSEERMTLSKIGFDREMFYSEQDFRKPKQEAETAAIIANTERADALARAELEASRVQTALSAINLNREKRGEAYLREEASPEYKKLLGIPEDQSLTNERARLLLGQRQTETVLKKQQTAAELSEMRTEIEMAPYREELTRENLGDVRSLYPEEARRGALRTSAAQFLDTFLNPATAFDFRAKADYFLQGVPWYDFEPMSPTSKYYDLQRRTGVDASQFVEPYSGVSGLLGRSIMQSQMSPQQQEYYEALNKSSSLFADPQLEFTQGAFKIQPPFPVPFGAYTNPGAFIPQVRNEDLEGQDE